MVHYLLGDTNKTPKVIGVDLPDHLVVQLKLSVDLVIADDPLARPVDVIIVCTTVCAEYKIVCYVIAHRKQFAKHFAPVARRRARGDIDEHFRGDIRSFGVGVEELAIDRQALIDAFYEGVGMVYYWPLQESDGPTVWTPLEETPEIAEYFTYDPEKAMQYMAEAGYPNGFKMEFIMGVGDTTADFGGMLQEFWAAIGIDADLKIMEEATIQSLGFDRANPGLISAGLQARPQSFNDNTRDHAYNYGGWYNEEFEEKWNIAKTTPDIPTRDALLKELYVLLKSTVPDVLIPSGAEWTAWWPWVKNYGGETSLGFHKHQYWAWTWIDEDLKKDMGY